AIWTCDSFAYYAGRSFGKHKLFERVSPKKTWEGAVAGAIGGVAAMIGMQQWFLPYLTVGDAVVIGFIAGVFGQLGDLAESHMKRDAGVKDSSQIIPGHGGIFDRFDSLLFVAPLVYIYLNFIVLTR
ncbi:MAG: phosphatidate cytidylyltransferase, partial [Bacteroidota bacterium]